MQTKYEEIMQEVDRRVSSTNLNDGDILSQSKSMICFLKERLLELKSYILTHPFANEAEEIEFFKHQKPQLVSILIYHNKILRIESQRPLDRNELDSFYEKYQEEQKRFFNRYTAFLQYYRSGATLLDRIYFLRDSGECTIDKYVCHFDDDPQFSTGYDNLVARIMAMDKLYFYLSSRRTYIKSGDDGVLVNILKTKGAYKWTGTIIELAELVYALNEVKCINNGESSINEIALFLGTIFGVNIKDCYSAYVDMKRRKDSSRTYFIDKMQERLNKKMDKDDER